MAEVPTVEIHSPKDASKKWRINASDYDPTVHQLWDDTGTERAEEVDVVATEPKPESAFHAGLTPSVSDFIEDQGGNIVSVNIIDPDRRTSRRTIAIDEYDPDQHDLWSTHPRFMPKGV